MNFLLDDKGKILKKDMSPAEVDEFLQKKYWVNSNTFQKAVTSGILISNEGNIIWKLTNEEKLEEALKRVNKMIKN